MLGVRRDPPEDLYGVMASYFGMVRFIDDALGQILDKLDELGTAGADNCGLLFGPRRLHGRTRHAVQGRGLLRTA